jgi:SAM-dependent methyltransferase
VLAEPGSHYSFNGPLTRTRLLQRAAALLDQLPFPSSTFDLVITSWVLEHLPRPSLAFAEAARVLRPGGHLITLAPNGWHPVALLNRLLAWSRLLRSYLVPRLYGRAEADAFPVHYRASTPRRLRQLAAEAGLTPIAIRTISDPTYLAFSNGLFAVSRRLEQLLPAVAGIHIVADFAREGTR